jgi:hypothetical protein
MSLGARRLHSPEPSKAIGGNGRYLERGLNRPQRLRPIALAIICFPQDKFLQKPVEVYLEQAQVPAGSNR